MNQPKEKYRLGYPNTITPNKRILQERDIIEMQDDGYLAMVDPIFRLWLISK